MIPALISTHGVPLPGHGAGLSLHHGCYCSARLGGKPHEWLLLWLVGCLTSLQRTSVSQRRIYLNNRHIRAVCQSRLPVNRVRRFEQKSTRNTQKSAWNTQTSTWNTQKKRVEHAETGRRHQKPNNNTTLTVLAHLYRWQRAKRERLVSAVLASAVRMNDAPRSMIELPSPCFPSLNKGWRAAKPGSDHVVAP